MTARELIEQEMGCLFNPGGYELISTNTGWRCAEAVIDRLQQQLKESREWPPIRDYHRERYRDRLDRMVAAGYGSAELGASANTLIEECVKLLAAIDAAVEERK